MARKTPLSKKLSMALAVDSTALLCPNPTEFYRKSYITEDLVDNFRIIAGVKYQTEIATQVFYQLLQADACAFSATIEGATLSAFNISVVPLSVMSQICRVDLETSFISKSMAIGSNGNWDNVTDFMTFYWDTMAKKVGEELAQLRWQGSVTGTTGIGHLALATGLEKKLLGGVSATPGPNTLGGVIGVGATATITTSNVLTEMNRVYNALGASAPAVAFRTDELRFYVSPDIATAYKVAAALGNTQAYITKEQDLTYLGIKVVPQPGMSAKKMVLTLKDNLIFACDGIDDEKQLKAINMEDTTADAYLRTRANLKVGFYAVNGPEIVYYY